MYNDESYVDWDVQCRVDDIEQEARQEMEQWVKNNVTIKDIIKIICEFSRDEFSDRLLNLTSKFEEYVDNDSDINLTVMCEIGRGITKKNEDMLYQYAQHLIQEENDEQQLQNDMYKEEYRSLQGRTYG